jgi:hypothetical protein
MGAQLVTMRSKAGNDAELPTLIDQRRAVEQPTTSRLGAQIAVLLVQAVPGT